ncbi:hypothetical protein [Salinibacter ruber]|uniref:hypothetical protein n=1 Tax=Salinibacter ruber TaxID=146919 RepID=UPI002167A5CE|nr:hypothetical protein [Salinibacter ruber]MCS4057165.1 hypothetical protein [Salinibacter ruber]MCS4059945.1 hypothetical protein [Salinibacter ruber]MCS4161562.1 hypothetical protein [Salinibacter ruber]
MVIQLSRELIESINNNHPNQDEIDALEYIALCRKEGSQVITGNRQVIKHIISTSGLTNRAKSIYKRIYEDVTKNRHINKYVSHVINVIRPYGESEKRRGETTYIDVPLNRFRNPSLIQNTVLLVENVDDAKVYNKIAKYYAYSENVSTNIEYSVIQGGGGNIHDQLEQFQRRNDRIVMCLVDSDKKHPSDELGQTAQNALSTYDEECSLCHLVILKEHELENLIPVYFLRRSTNSNTQERSAVENIDSLSKVEDLSKIRKFIDIKNGTKLGEIVDGFRDVDNVELRYLSQAFSSIHYDCVHPPNCQSPEQCRCTINHPVGANNTANAIQSVSQSPLGHIDEHINQSLSIAWKSLGRTIYSWLCSSMPVRS